MSRDTGTAGGPRRRRTTACIPDGCTPPKPRRPCPPTRRTKPDTVPRSNGSTEPSPRSALLATGTHSPSLGTSCGPSACEGSPGRSPSETTWSIETAATAAVAAAAVPTMTCRRVADRPRRVVTGSIVPWENCWAIRLFRSATNSGRGSPEPGLAARSSIAARICAASKSSAAKDSGRRPASRSSTYFPTPRLVTVTLPR